MFVGGAQRIAAARTRPGEFDFARFGTVKLQRFGHVSHVFAANAGLDEIADLYFRNHLLPAICERDARVRGETVWARLREILDGLLIATAAAATPDTGAEIREQRTDHAADVGSGLFGDAGKHAGDIAENFHAHGDGAGA